jgi:hypothetical protein
MIPSARRIGRHEFSMNFAPVPVRGCEGGYAVPGFRAGDWAEVRSLSQIEATLDGDGRLAGMPFMAEMARHVGRRYRVRLVADRTCVHPPQHPFPRLSNCVTLAGLRCAGSAHGGCELGCMLFWKTAWLRPVSGPVGGEPGGGEPAVVQEAGAAAAQGLAEWSIGADGSYVCQGTQLISATTAGEPLLSPGQYVRLLRDRTFTPAELVGMAARMAARKLGSRLRRPVPVPEGVDEPLRPGDWVRVRSRAQIRGTLDRSGALGGLAFGGEMAEDCGKILQVERRVERIMDERNGRIRSVRNTVLLRGSLCDRYLGCARGMPILWREAWLERVAGPVDAPRSKGSTRSA